MKKFLLMFAAVAAIAFVGCKTDNKPVEETPVEEETVAPAEYTVESVTTDLMKFVDAGDEAGTLNFLDGLKAKAEEILNGGDQAGYFNIINILKTIWDTNKDAIIKKIPALAEKMGAYLEVPENLKAGFAEFAAKAAADAAAQKVGEAVDAAGDAVAEAADKAADKAGEVVDDAKNKVAEGAQKVADELKK